MCFEKYIFTHIQVFILYQKLKKTRSTVGFCFNRNHKLSHYIMLELF